jgi:hypothetical protein
MVGWEGLPSHVGRHDTQRMPRSFVRRHQPKDPRMRASVWAKNRPRWPQRRQPGPVDGPVASARHQRFGAFSFRMLFALATPSSTSFFGSALASVAALVAISLSIKSRTGS